MGMITVLPPPAYTPKWSDNLGVGLGNMMGGYMQQKNIQAERRRMAPILRKKIELEFSNKGWTKLLPGELEKLGPEGINEGFSDGTMKRWENDVWIKGRAKSEKKSFDERIAEKEYSKVDTSNMTPAEIKELKKKNYHLTYEGTLYTKPRFAAEEKVKNKDLVWYDDKGIEHKDVVPVNKFNDKVQEVIDAGGSLTKPEKVKSKDLEYFDAEGNKQKEVVPLDEFNDRVKEIKADGGSFSKTEKVKDKEILDAAKKVNYGRPEKEDVGDTFMLAKEISKMNPTFTPEQSASYADKALPLLDDSDLLKPRGWTSKADVKDAVSMVSQLIALGLNTDFITNVLKGNGWSAKDIEKIMGATTTTPPAGQELMPTEQFQPYPMRQFPSTGGQLPPIGQFKP